jgi:hypothetical protein
MGARHVMNLTQRFEFMKFVEFIEFVRLIVCVRGNPINPTNTINPINPTDHQHIVENMHLRYNSREIHISTHD